MYYAYFILTQYSAEELNQNDDDMSCETEVTVTTGATFYIQHTRFNLPEEFWHAADDAQSVSKMKRTSAASRHIQNFMGVISHQPSKW